MSNIQEDLSEKLKKAKQNFLDSVNNLEKEVLNKVEATKDIYELRIKGFEEKQNEDALFSTATKELEIGEMEQELVKVKEDKDRISKISQEKEGEINNLKMKMEDFINKIFVKIEKVEDLIKK